MATPRPATPPVKPEVKPPPLTFPTVELKPEPVEEPVAEASLPLDEVPPADAALEQQATALISQRCSKCHSLGRVYGRLDTFERSMATLSRMRFKTGSGITDDELKLLEGYLRTQF